MAHTKMLDAYPKDVGKIDRDKLAECIAACFECAQVCTACADACLAEDMVAELAKCIRTDLDCADICLATGNALSRHTGYDANVTRAFLEHRSPGHAHDVAGDRGQLDAGVLQQLLKPLHTSRPRSRVIAVLARVRSRSWRIGSGGTNDPRTKPCAPSWASQVASATSLLRPGSVLTWRALPSITSTPGRSSSR